MHGLLRCNINTCVHALTQSRRVTQRCHNSPRWETGLQSSNDITHQKRSEDLGGFCKGQWVELRYASEKDGWLSVAREALGKSQHRKIVPLSPYVEEPLNSKVIKSFVPEQRSRMCFSCFEIPMFYVYIYEHYMSISHIAVSGYGTNILMAVLVFFFRRLYARSVFSTFSLCMESNAIEKSTNNLWFDG